MNLLPNVSIGHPRLRLRLAFALLALLAAAGILGLGINVFTNERRTAIDKANDANLTAARLLAEHGFQLIRTCDVLLVHMIDAVSTANGPVLPAQHDLMLRSLVSRFTEVSFLLLIDGEGNLRWSSAMEQVSPINYADRSYFRRHLAGEDLIIGEPIVSRSTGKSILPVTRAIRDGKGKLTGVVLAAIETRYIDHVFNSARLANSDAVALFMADGTLVARQPPVGVGQRFLSAVSIDRVTREPSGAYETVSPVDGTPRLVAYARVATYGLVVVVSQTTANVFASSRLLGLRFILVGLTGLFIVFILTRFALDALKGEETALASLHIANERLSTVVAAVPEGIFGLHEDGRITFANEAALAIIGYQTADVVGADVQLLLRNPQDDQESESSVDCPLKQSVRSGAHGTADAQFWRKDGSSLPVEYVVGPMALAGGGRGAVVIFRDISERKRTQEQIRQLAYFDTLTNLPNRRMLVDRLDYALVQAKRHRRSMAVMFLDLDKFKEINDTLGHDFGDELLKVVATRLTECVRAGDMVCRQGGDEFVVVLSEIARPEDAATVAEKIIERVRNPITVSEAVLRVTTSIGVAVFPVDGVDDARELMKKADMAMYQAKQAGCDRYAFANALAVSHSQVQPSVQ